MTQCVNPLVCYKTRPHAYVWQPDCPVCHVALTIYLEAPALKIRREYVNCKTRYAGKIGRWCLATLNHDRGPCWYIEKFTPWGCHDEIYCLQTVRWLQKAGFSASIYSLTTIVTANLMARSVVWKAPCPLELVMLLWNIWVWLPSKCIC